MYVALLNRAQHPQPITKIMRVLDDGTLPLLPHLLRIHEQEPHSTSLRLPLRKHNNRFALNQLASPMTILIKALRIITHPFRTLSLSRSLSSSPTTTLYRPRERQPTPGARQPGSHERSAGEDEADGAAIDADGGEGGGEAVDELEVRQQRVVHVLEEQGVAVEHVQGAAVGQLHGLEGALLRQDLVDVPAQEGVGRQQRLAQPALHRRLQLRLGGCVDPR